MNITYRLTQLIRTSPALFAGLFAVLYVLGASNLAFAQTQNQADKCYEDYNGKQLTQQKYDNQYKKSNCPASKGGNCTHKSTGNGSNVYFDITCSKKAGQAPGGGGGDTDKDKDTSTGCGGVDTAYIECDATGNGAIVNMLMAIINFMAIGVGILAVGGIVWGSLLYTTSNGESAKAQQGITVIVNAVIGLLVFIFMYAIIDVLVPGGLF